MGDFLLVPGSLKRDIKSSLQFTKLKSQLFNAVTAREIKTFAVPAPAFFVQPAVKNIKAA